MNRYYKLQNGDIFDNQTKTTLDRDKLIEGLTSDERLDLFEVIVSDDNTLDPDWKKFIDRVKDSEVKNELDRNKDSVLD